MVRRLRLRRSTRIRRRRTKPGNNGYLERSGALPVHLWLAPAEGGEAKRLTSGKWSLPNFYAPGPPPSPISFTPDGGSLVFVKADSPLTGETDSSRVQILDIATGALRPLTQGPSMELAPVLSPDGSRVAYMSSRDGKPRNEDSAFVVPIGGGAKKDVAYDLDRAIGGAAWLPDNQSLALMGTDGTRSCLWLQPIGGQAKKA